MQGKEIRLSVSDFDKCYRNVSLSSFMSISVFGSGAVFAWKPPSQADGWDMIFVHLWTVRNSANVSKCFCITSNSDMFFVCNVNALMLVSFECIWMLLYMQALCKPFWRCDKVHVLLLVSLFDFSQPDTNRNNRPSATVSLKTSKEIRSLSSEASENEPWVLI